MEEPRLNLNEEVEILRRTPRFAEIDPARLKLLCFAGERMTFGAGQTLFRKGEPGDCAFVILDGEAEVIAETPSGPVIVATVRRSGIVGEIAVLCDGPRRLTVRALSDVVTLKVSKDLFMRMMMDFPEIAAKTVRDLAERLDRTIAELEVCSDPDGFVAS